MRMEPCFSPLPRGPHQYQVVSTRPAMASKRGVLDEERAVAAAVRGRLTAREEGGHDVAVVGLDEDAAAGVDGAAQRGEDGEVVVLAWRSRAS